IWSCETLEPSGGISADQRVYCPERAEAMSIKTCASCPRLRPLRSTSHVLVCSVAQKPHPHGGGPVGAAIAGVARAVPAAAALEAVRGLLPDDLDGLPVIDESGRLIGAVSVQSALRAFAAPNASVGDLADQARATEESETVSDVLRAMAHAHARRLPVVS